MNSTYDQWGFVFSGSSHRRRCRSISAKSLRQPHHLRRQALRKSLASLTASDPIEALAKRKRVLPHIVPAIIGMSQPPETLTDYLRFNSQAVYRVIAASSGVRSARNPWFFSSKLVKPSSDNAVRMRSLSGQPITSSSVYGLFVDDGP